MILFLKRIHFEICMFTTFTFKHLVDAFIQRKQDKTLVGNKTKIPTKKSSLLLFLC